MKFLLLTDHHANDRILPAGLEVDFDDPTYGYKKRGRYSPPSLHMKPLDDEARKAYLEAHPEQEGAAILDPLERMVAAQPFANVIKSSAPGDTLRPGESDNGRLVPKKEVAEGLDTETLKSVDVGEPIGRMNADKATLPEVANVETDVIKSKVEEAKIKDDLSAKAQEEEQKRLAEFDEKERQDNEAAQAKTDEKLKELAKQKEEAKKAELRAQQEAKRG